MLLDSDVERETKADGQGNNSKVFSYSVCDTFNKLNSENKKRKFKFEINNGDDDHSIDVQKSVRDTIKKTSAIRKSRL